MYPFALRVSVCFIAVAAIMVCASDMMFANGTVREAEYSTSLSEATGVVRIVVAVFGGLIGLLGIIVALKGVGGTADVAATVGKSSLSMKRISQGVVLTLIGAGVLIGTLYFLPEKKTERELTGKEISIEREPGKTKEVLKK
ncbi:MAG: hypothetical protein HRU72_06425 [Planctomycetia bacterium]|nr:hypothetical protein [Candidatus Brocadia sp.]QOJ06210.1 MAG: hypothetical protein HRU72_06425 [Planctomycetia bacterium]TVL94750.1 MAG: hypothetical protein CV082_13630 [Candidatus Brocadia sp. BL1]HQU32382.1 hypothetical protein [Candidatus Brocadia sapporoensis]